MYFIYNTTCLITKQKNSNLRSNIYIYEGNKSLAPKFVKLKLNKLTKVFNKIKKKLKNISCKIICGLKLRTE